MSASKAVLAEVMTEEAALAINHLMKTVMANPIQLHSIVAGGLHHWMIHSSKAFAGMAVDDQVLRDIFHYFKQHADPNPAKTLDELMRPN